MFFFYKGALTQNLSIARDDFDLFQRFIEWKLRGNGAAKIERGAYGFEFTMPFFRRGWQWRYDTRMAFVDSGQFEFSPGAGSMTYTFFMRKLLILVGVMFVPVIIAVVFSGDLFIFVPFLLLVVLVFGLNAFFLYRIQKYFFQQLETEFVELKNIFSA